ncbi:MAG: YcxB family protein [Dehalococcoidia bacterium]|nr:YcxB family protein [Dehalococcoidia bacterium]
MADNNNDKVDNVSFIRTVSRSEFFLLSLLKPSLWRCLIISILAFTLAITLELLPESLRTLQIAVRIISIVIGIISLLAVFRFLLNIVKWISMKQFNALFLPQRLTFNHLGIQIENPGSGVVLRKWDGFKKCRKTTSEYILYLNPSGLIVINKEDVPPPQIEPFEILLRNSVNHNNHEMSKLAV